MAVGVFGSLAIALDGTVFEESSILTDKFEFIKCVFMYQVVAYRFLSEEINFSGIIILETLITASVWFLNIIVFGTLIIVLILKVICYLFWIVFRKKNKD